jgi:predicted metal-dependent phosphoesterase TrpH
MAIHSADIVQRAHERDYNISHYDHDTIDGVKPALEAARNYPGLTVIPGVEINTDIQTGELHLLGYLFDTTDKELINTLERLRNSRIGRAQKMVQKLSELGINIDFQRVKELAGEGSIGRPHIAQAMLEKGYVANFKEAFIKYTARDARLMSPEIK